MKEPSKKAVRTNAVKSTFVPIEEKEEEIPTTSYPKDTCIHGHRFGYDCEKYPICDTCEVWDNCLKAKEKAKNKPLPEKQ